MDLAVVVLSILLGLLLATRVPLIDPDEGRNSEVGREMLERGDWVVPHLAGTPYLDKPPALFWGVAIATRLFGPHRLVPRLPAILAATLTLLAIARLARRLGGEALAWRAVALLAAAPLFAVIGVYVIFDMPLTFCVTVVWTLVASELTDGPSPGRRTVMFAAFALGLLIKGPAMLAWTFGGSIVTAVLARRREPVAWLAWWPGWVLVLATTGVWFAAVSARHPEFPHYAVFEESVERFSTRHFGRDQPWWFVPVTILAGALPWSLFTPWHRLRDARGAHGSPRRAAVLVAIGFFAFAVVFFGVSRSKLVTYLVPALPPLAFLAGLAWDGVRGRARGAVLAAVVLVPLFLVGGLPRGVTEAEKSSGEPLLRAAQSLGIAAPRIRYERCYSPGTDYLLGRRNVLMTERGDEATSVYQGRYMKSLIARGLWAARDYGSTLPDADVIVRPKIDDWAPPEGWEPFFRDGRFTAYRRIR